MNKQTVVVRPNKALHKFYARDFKVKPVAEGDHYKALRLSGNCGYEHSQLQKPEDEQQWREVKARRKVHLNGAELQCKSANNIVFYSADLSDLLPEANWKIRLHHLREDVFGVVFYHPDFENECSDIRSLNQEDFRPAGTPQCDSSHRVTSGANMGEMVPCEREADHRGMHQAISGQRIIDWSPAYSCEKGLDDFGFVIPCAHCGYMLVRTEQDKGKPCLECDFWLQQYEHGGKNQFIIDGRHYRPGKGGFGGRTLHVTRKDGSKWSGELFTQGAIPEGFKDLLADNAVFSDPE